MMKPWTFLPMWQETTDKNILSLTCGQPCNCCIFKYKEYNTPRKKCRYSPRKKAGVIMKSKDTNKLLVVQSRGRLWGVPKGGIEDGESAESCAIRELQEETGVVLKNCTKFAEKKFTNGTYFEVDADYEIPVSMGDKFDSTGVGWATKSCLIFFKQKKQVDFTSDFKRILKEV